MTAVWRDAVQVILLLYDGDLKCSPPTEHIVVVPKVCLVQSEARNMVGWIGRKDSEDRSGDDASPASCTPDERGRMQRRKEVNYSSGYTVIYKQKASETLQFSESNQCPKGVRKATHNLRMFCQYSVHAMYKKSGRLGYSLPLSCLSNLSCVEGVYLTLAY